jgi:histidine ammonia-lyase
VTSAVTITGTGDPDPGLIRAVAVGRRVAIAPGLLAAVQRSCEQARQALRGGQPVYGVNTGLGALSSVRLTEEQQRSHQRNLLLARAAGGPPWLDPPEVRAILAARIHRLMDPAVTGLPAQLAREPGPQAGLSPVHKRAAGEVHAMRGLAAATAVGLIETSGGQEDAQAFAWEAAEKLRAALRHAHAVTACELLAGYQAAALSGRPAPPGGRALLDWLAGIIGPIEGDRTFGEDVEHVIGAGWPPAPGSGCPAGAVNHESFDKKS